MIKVKNIVYTILILVISISLVGCGNESVNGVSDEQIQSDLQNDVSDKQTLSDLQNGVSDKQIVSDLQESMSFASYGFIIQSTEIIKRQTNIENKEDFIYISANLQNEYFNITKSFKMTYNLYNEGWILDDLSLYNDDYIYEINVVKFPKDEELIQDLTKIHPIDSFGLSNFTLVDECQIVQQTVSENNLSSDWYYIYDYGYFTYRVSLTLYYSPSNDFKWDKNADITKCEYIYNDNIVGTWTTQVSDYYNDYGWENVTINISKEKDDIISVVRERENRDYTDDYECDIRLLNDSYGNPYSLQLGPVMSTYYIAIDPDGLYYHCVCDNQPAYKLNKK